MAVSASRTTSSLVDTISSSTRCRTRSCHFGNSDTDAISTASAGNLYSETSSTTRFNAFRERSSSIEFERLTIIAERVTTSSDKRSLRPLTIDGNGSGTSILFKCLSIIIIGPGLDSRARTALEHMLESVVSARGKVLRTNFSATSRVTRATKLTQAASRHSYRWCSPPTRGSATTFAVGDGRCVTVLKLGVSLFSPKWQRSS